MLTKLVLVSAAAAALGFAVASAASGPGACADAYENPLDHYGAAVAQSACGAPAR